MKRENQTQINLKQQEESWSLENKAEWEQEISKLRKEREELCTKLNQLDRRVNKLHELINETVTETLECGCRLQWHKRNWNGELEKGEPLKCRLPAPNCKVHNWEEEEEEE
jgi:chromosome segregation ATPase